MQEHIGLLKTITVNQNIKETTMFNCVQKNRSHYRYYVARWWGNCWKKKEFRNIERAEQHIKDTLSRNGKAKLRLMEENITTTFKELDMEKYYEGSTGKRLMGIVDNKIVTSKEP